MSSDQTDQAPKPARRSGRWVRVLLFVSLALNLLILGAVAGAVMGQRPDRAGGPPSASLVRDLGLGPYMLALQSDDRKAIRSAAGGERGTDLHAGRRAMRSAYEETIVVLRAETLDSERLLVLIQQQAEAADVGRQLGQRLLVERISRMSLSERHKVAERLETHLKRRGPRYKQHKSGKGEGQSYPPKD